jgi:hypothetical protein
MKSNSVKNLFVEQRLIKPVYLFLLFVLGLTGFAQMPIFKRYYIADIPGLGWLAQFYDTHTIHYIGAILLLFLMVYSAVFYLGVMRKRFDLTIAAYVHISLLIAIVGRGLFRVLKNLPHVVFSPDFTMWIDISHLGFMFVFMFFGIITTVTRTPWLKQAPKTDKIFGGF